MGSGASRAPFRHRLKNNDFLEQMNSSQFKQIEMFFTTMPKLSHTIKVTNPATGVESDIVLEGLGSFFA